MTWLLSEKFLADPRIAEARKLLASAVADHAKNLSAIRPADADRKIAYDELIKTFGEARGGALFYPYLGSGIGNGPFVELADGSVKMDLISGIGVHHFGHSNPRLMSAALDAALRDTIMQGNLEQNVESTRLAAAFVKSAAANSKIAHCFIATSGAMANENALKLAFHKRPGTSRILAFEHAFAGRTLALTCITDKAAYRVGLPTALIVDYLPYFDSADPAGSTSRALAALKNILARYPNQHAAIWCEFVQGEGGFYTGSKEFFQTLFAEAKKQNIAIVADEVQTFGRTSKLYAFQHFQVEDLVDIVTVGKMTQVCATLFAAAYKPGPGLISQTFTASTSAIFAAEAILNELLAENLFGPAGRNMQVHNRFVQRFGEIEKRHPGFIRGSFGLGGMIALTPLDGTEPTVKKVLQTLFENGVIAFFNGASPTRLRFLPPIPALTDAHIDTVCAVLEESLVKVSNAGVSPASSQK